MIKRPIKVIFFDAAETLFKTRGSVGDIYLQIAKKYGSKAAKESIDNAFFNAFKKKPPPVFLPSKQTEREEEKAYVRCETASKASSEGGGDAVPSPAERIAIEKGWWYEVVKGVFTEVGMFPSFEEYFQEVYAVFKGSQGWELFPETAEVLSEIKKRGYPIGMITNFDSRVYEVTRALGIEHLIDSMTLSSEAGAPKPNPQIFKKAVETHQVEPGEALHVGDSLSDDVRGALNAGLQAVLIDRYRIYQAEENFVKIESLDELLHFL